MRTEVDIIDSDTKESIEKFIATNPDLPTEGSYLEVGLRTFRVQFISRRYIPSLSTDSRRDCLVLIY